MTQRGTRDLIGDERGGITIIAAFVLPVLIGIAALVTEFGYGLLTKVKNQRVADSAAFAGALAYGSTGSEASMISAAAKVAALNGIASSAVNTTLIASPTGSGNQAVSVSIATTELLMLAPVIRSGSSLAVSASASAEMQAQAAGCIIALSSSGTGITLSGGTAVSAPSCAVSSNATVSVPCGTTITTKAVNYFSSSPPSQPCNGIRPPAGTSSVKITKVVTSDPLASDGGVASATARVTTTAGYSAPTMSAVAAGTNIDFAWTTSSTQSQAVAAGCTASFSGSTWTLTCPSGGTYNFGNITLGGGITVNFNTGGSAATTYNFSGSITNTGTALTFGPGTFNIARGLITGGGTTTTFGAGTFNIGASTSACSGGALYSVCNTGASLVFGGPSTFKLTSGLFNNGGSRLTLGSGTANSFELGPSSTGNAIVVRGGSTTTFGDALGGTSLFRIVGNVDGVTGGGSCLSFGAAAQHDIKGFLSVAGGTVLGAGAWSVTNYAAFGASGGGDVTCSGQTVGVRGIGVTLAIGGASTPSGGSCSGQAFCVAAGFSNVTLTAPETGTTAKLAVIGPSLSTRTGGAAFAEGASGTSLSGAFYFPYGPIALSGGATVGNGAGQCLQFIGTQITLSGGTAAASRCVGQTSASSAAILVR